MPPNRASRAAFIRHALPAGRDEADLTSAGQASAIRFARVCNASPMPKAMVPSCARRLRAPEDELVRLDLALTRGEWELWDRAAEAQGVTTSEFVRTW